MDYQIASKYFKYIPETGDIIRVAPSVRSNGRPCGIRVNHKADIKTTNGYLKCQLTHDGISYSILSHRLAWLLYHKSNPSDQIDHKNGNRSDNRISNLREADASLNQRNRTKKAGASKDLPIGIYRRTRNGRTGVWFEVKCQANGKTLSTMKRNLDDAIKARKSFEEKLWKNN